MKRKLAFVNAVPLPEEISAFATLLKAESLSQAAKRGLKPTTGDLTWAQYYQPVVTIKTGENRFEHRDIGDPSDLIETLESSKWVHANFNLALDVESDGSTTEPPFQVDDSLRELWDSMNRDAPVQVITADVSIENADQRYGSKFDVTIESEWEEAVEALVGFWNDWSQARASETDDGLHLESHFREMGFPNTRLTSDALKGLIAAAQAFMANMIDRNEGWRLATSGGDELYGSLEHRTVDGFYERRQFTKADEFFNSHDDPAAGWSLMRWDASIEVGNADDLVIVVSSVGISAHWEGGAHTISVFGTDSGLVGELADLAQASARGSSIKVHPVIFVGHGRSNDWSSVNLYLRSLGLTTDYFEAAPRAGLEASAIVVAMVESADFAVIVMTAEDETSAGSADMGTASPATQMRARQNVVHELGLAQGVLGVSRVVMLVEHGIEILSNVISIQQIRYSSGSITNTFDELKNTILREFPGALDGDARPSVGKSQTRYPWPNER